MNTFSGLRKIVETVVKGIADIEAQYNTLDIERKALEKLPMHEASVYWHEDKYLYLIYPTQDGYRPRKYVGNKPEKVQEALEAVERFKKHQDVLENINGIKNRVFETQFLLQQCLRKIENRNR